MAISEEPPSSLPCGHFYLVAATPRSTDKLALDPAVLTFFPPDEPHARNKVPHNRCPFCAPAARVGRRRPVNGVFFTEFRASSEALSGCLRS